MNWVYEFKPLSDNRFVYPVNGGSKYSSPKEEAQENNDERNYQCR